MKDVIESRRVGKAIRPRENSAITMWQAIQRLPEYFRADYVEGMVVVAGISIEHGWVEKDG